MIARAPTEALRTFRWYLESFVEGGRQLRRITLYPLPFRVGRLAGLGLTLSSESVSKKHAEIFLHGEELFVRDLGSKNGTFVNHQAVDKAMLREGDIIHFARVEFRVGRQEIEPTEARPVDPPTAALGDTPLPQRFVEGARDLPELFSGRQVTAVFQPIVNLPGGALAGYEAFGRGCHPRLPEMPLELFRVAGGLDAQAELSQLFRERALALAESQRRVPALFVNVHPAELDMTSLLPSLEAARQRAPSLHLTLEVDERALADLEAMEKLRTELSRLDVGLAYDGFGAGQARLLELAEVPPQYLKFDMRFVHGIASAPPSRQRLLTSLLSVARDLLVETVAEGVETAEEADVCARVGFTHAQGYYFGRPRPIEEI